MKYIFKKICVPLLCVNNNVYAFVSGIMISLATNIFATLCFQLLDLKSQLYQYLASFVFAVASAICLYVSTKTSAMQNYISSKKIRHLKDREKIISDVTATEYKKWIAVYSGLFVTIVIGVVLLLFGFFLHK